MTLNVAANQAPVARNDGSNYTTPTSYSAITTITLNKGVAGNGRLDLTPLIARQFASTILTANDTDADGTIAPNTLALQTFTAGGTPAGRFVTATRINPNNGNDADLPGGNTEASASFDSVSGLITFTPRVNTGTSTVPLGQFGLYRIRYNVKDDQGATSNTVTAYIYVN